MNWQQVDDYAEMSELTAGRIFRIVAGASASGRRVNLGLATGNTMLELYQRLARKFNVAHVDLSRLHTYNLDEYVGPDGRAVPETHPLSYRRYMKANLFDALDPGLGFSMDSQAHFPDPVSPDRFDRDLAAAGGIDFQLLGIGFNGHIAFNEPIPATEISPDGFAALPSRVVALKELTIQTNSRLTAGNDDALVPRHAVTMGMAQILSAREVMLLACFPEQVHPLTAMLNGKPTPELPASFLLDHPDTTIVYTGDTICMNAEC